MNCFSPYHESPGVRTQGIRHGSKFLYPMSHLVAQPVLLKYVYFIVSKVVKFASKKLKTGSGEFGLVAKSTFCIEVLGLNPSIHIVAHNHL